MIDQSPSFAGFMRIFLLMRFSLFSDIKIKGEFRNLVSLDDKCYPPGDYSILISFDHYLAYIVMQDSDFFQLEVAIEM